MGKWDGKENRRESDKYDQTEQRIKDAVIFILGMAGSVNEIWYVEAPRPYILAFIASFLGVPFILRADSLRRKKERNKDGESE